MDVARESANRLDDLASAHALALQDELRAIAKELREAEQRSVFNLSTEAERAATIVQRLAALDDLEEGSYAVFDKDLDRFWVAHSLRAAGGEPDEILIPIPSGRSLLPEARASVVGGLIRHLEWGSHMRQIADTSEQIPFEVMVVTATRHLFSGARGAAVSAENALSSSA